MATKITHKAFKRKIHIKGKEWSYRISQSQVTKLTYLNVLSPDGKNQKTFTFEKKGTDGAYCCELKCYWEKGTYFDPLTPSFVKEVIIKDQELNKKC